LAQIGTWSETVLNGVNATVFEPFIDVSWVEADELADFEVGDSAFGHKASDEPGRDAEPMCGCVDIEEGLVVAWHLGSFGCLVDNKSTLFVARSFELPDGLGRCSSLGWP